jgi:hypothetical protein
MGHLDNGFKLLSVLHTKITSQDLEVLSYQGGFQPPNDFNVYRIERVLETGQFPLEDHYEYAWAIYECSLGIIQRMSPYIKVLLSALFIFCRKRTSWGVPIENEYYQLGLDGVFECGEDSLSSAFLGFLNWLNAEVAAVEDGYESYFSLLSLAYLSANRGQANGEVFEMLLDELSEKVTNRTDADLTISSAGLSWWREISANVVDGDAVKKRLVAVLPSLLKNS